MKRWINYECIEKRDDFEEGEKKSIAFTDLDGSKKYTGFHYPNENVSGLIAQLRRKGYTNLFQINYRRK